MRTTKTQNKRVYGSKRWLLTLLATVLLLPGLSLTAQVTIGQGEEPVNGALLQLKDKANVNGKNANATKGLGMPRVELTSETDLFPMYPDNASYTSVKATVDPQHTGLMVYNLSSTAPFSEGVYVWNGTKWLAVGSGGGGGTGASTFWYGVGTTEAHTSNTDPSYLDAEVVVGGTTPYKFGSADATLSVLGTAYIQGQTRIGGQTLLTTKATVGSANNTRIGSLLDLKENSNTGKTQNATKGLGMPRMKLTSETNLFPMFTSGAANYTGTNKTTQDLQHTGLMVYNLSDDDPFSEGVYVWDGTKWLSVATGGTPGCPWPKIAAPTSDMTITGYDGYGMSLIVELLPALEQVSPYYTWYDENDNVITTAPNSGSYKFTAVKATHNGKSYYCKITNDCGKSVTSPKFTLNILDNPSVLPPGYTIEGASLTGRTCFDINRSNYGDMCGLQASRAASAANFKTLGGVPYTFRAPSAGVVTNLRFMVIDEEGCVSSYSGGDIPGTVANGSTSTLTVYYNPNLNDNNSIPLIVGRAAEAAAKVHIYAIFNYDGSDVSLQLTASIQDCNCCSGAPAMVSEYAQLKQYTTSDVSPGAGNFAATGQNLCIAKEDGASTAAWAGALNGCITGLLSDGQSGWRLPNLAEMSAVHGVGQNLATSPSSSPGTTNLRTTSSYWSSSESSPTAAWYVVAATGSISYNSKGTSYYIRCVRSY